MNDTKCKQKHTRVEHMGDSSYVMLTHNNFGVFLKRHLMMVTKLQLAGSHKINHKRASIIMLRVAAPASESLLVWWILTDYPIRRCTLRVGPTTIVN